MSTTLTKGTPCRQRFINQRQAGETPAPLSTGGFFAAWGWRPPDGPAATAAAAAGLEL